MANIYESISACMAEIGAIGKDKKNQQQNFMYRGVEQVMNALQPVLVKNHVFVTPQVIEHTREERQSKSGGNLLYTILKVKYTFYAEDGSSIETIVIGEGMDSADKSSNKAMAAAFKYACFQTLCIPTEETHQDPDNETPPPSKPITNGSKNPPAEPDANHKRLSRDQAVLELKGILERRFGNESLNMCFAITGYKTPDDIPTEQLGAAIKKVKTFQKAG